MLSEHLDFAFQEQKFWDKVSRQKGNPVLREMQTAQALEPDRSNPVCFSLVVELLVRHLAFLKLNFLALAMGTTVLHGLLLFSTCDPRTAVSASLGNLWEMQNVRHSLGPTALEILGVAQHTFHKPSRWFSLRITNLLIKVSDSSCQNKSSLLSFFICVRGGRSWNREFRSLLFFVYTILLFGDGLGRRNEKPILVYYKLSQ